MSAETSWRFNHFGEGTAQRFNRFQRKILMRYQHRRASGVPEDQGQELGDLLEEFNKTCLGEVGTECKRRLLLAPL